MANATTQATVPDGTVTTRVADGVGHVEFGHPKGNSLPGALLRAVAEAVTAMGADPAVRVIGLRSAGSGPFCAGASFDELATIADEARGQEFFSGFSRVILAMIRAPKFVVTRVQGRAAGGAVGLIAASDYALASSRGALKLSELAVGIGPFVVGPVIAHKIGLAAFSQMAVDADWRDSAWGAAQGLYARVLDTEPLLDEAFATQLHTLAASNPEAMALLKQVFWQGTEHWETLLAERAAMSGRLVLSDFTRGAIAKFKAG